MSSRSRDYIDLTLIVVLTPKVPLSKWKELGMFEREVSLYTHIATQVKRVIFINDSDNDESEIFNAYENIEVWQKSKLYYHLRQHQELENINEHVIIKTNQTKSALTALYLKWYLNKPLIARGGYQLSDFAKRRKDLNIFKKIFYIFTSIIIEKFLFNFADSIIVTTNEALNYVSKWHKVRSEIFVIPNYVDIQTFKPIRKTKKYDIICVGRLSIQKNHLHLFNVAYGTNYTIALVGNGEEKNRLEEKAKEMALNVTFLGQLNSEELPSILNEAKIFALCSDFEGDPKTLIEAMSCGLPTLTKMSQGCLEIVGASNSGISTNDINEARDWLDEVFNSPEKYDGHSHASRNYITKERSLERIAYLEMRLYENILKMVT